MDFRPFTRREQLRIREACLQNDWDVLRTFNERDMEEAERERRREIDATRKLTRGGLLLALTAAVVIGGAVCWLGSVVLPNTKASAARGADGDGAHRWLLQAETNGSPSAYRFATPKRLGYEYDHYTVYLTAVDGVRWEEIERAGIVFESDRVAFTKSAGPLTGIPLIFPREHSLIVTVSGHGGFLSLSMLQEPARDRWDTAEALVARDGTRAQWVIRPR